VRARRRERLPPFAAEHLLVRLEGQPRVRDRRLAPHRLGLRRADLLQALVDLGVHARDEERGDGADARQVDARTAGPLHAVEEGVHDLAVAVEGEDERHVDADALGQALADRRKARLGGGDLDEQVRPVDQPPQAAGLRDRPLGLVREPGIDLDGHPAVHAVGRLVHRAQHVAGPPHVVRRDVARRPVHGDAAQRQVVHLRVVQLALGDRLLEDRRIGRDADDEQVADQGRQAVAGQSLP
jgi:hypothetical protein